MDFFGPKKRFLSATLSLVMISAPVFAAEKDDFEAFKRQQTEQAQAVNSEFDDYEKKLLEEFALYKKTYDEAFEEFKQKIDKKWGEFKTGDKSVWISYTNNNTVRRTVDYVNGTITIEKISSAPQLSKQSQKDFLLELPNLLMETEAQAFRGDEVAMRVEEAVSQNKEMVQQGKPSNRRVLDTLIADLQAADIKEIGALSNQLSEKTDVKTRKALVPGKTVHVVSYELSKFVPDKSRIFADTIEKVAQKEEVPIALVYAVIEAESNFNPLARSDAPAYGLMQIVPFSAGKDATRYLFGKPKILAPSYLYNSDNNIAIGGAYLHVLYYDYLTGIDHPVSRLYCAIAAYNTGTGNVARAFNGDTNMKNSAPIINRSSPQEVFDTLSAQLPYEETRVYIKTVSQKMNKYEKKS